MDIRQAELLFRTDLILGEGARWFPARKNFLYVDILGKKLGFLDPIGKTVKEMALDKKIGAAFPAENGFLILALQGSLEALNPDTGSRTILAEIEPGETENRCNDGGCDSAGRLWIGTMHQEARPRQGALYSYQSALVRKIKGVSISNGICWSPDNTVCYHIDSADYTIRAFDFDAASGEISGERVVVEIKESEGMPDGMTIDTSGQLWVAIWGGFAVHRYDPRTGLLTGKVMVDAPQVSSCAFGGDRYDTLMITTARVGMDQEQLCRYPLSGSLFAVRTGSCGMPVHHFRRAVNGV